MRSRHGRRIIPWSTPSAPPNQRHDGAPSQTLAAVLYTVAPEANDFSLSEPGTLTILENGRTRFTPSPGGRHHYLVARPEQKERVLETYVKSITTQPPPPPARGRRGGAAALMVGAAIGASLLLCARTHQRPGRRVRDRRPPGPHTNMRAVSWRAAPCRRHERERPDVF